MGNLNTEAVALIDYSVGIVNDGWKLDDNVVIEHN